MQEKFGNLRYGNAPITNIFFTSQWGNAIQVIVTKENKLTYHLQQENMFK
jgi:hypothetical protein